MRIVVGVLGLAAMAYGGLLLVRRLSIDLFDSGVWLAGGVVAHDLVLAPLVIGLGLLLLPRLPVVARAPVTVGAVVLASVTLVAVPVLGRFGASPGNPTLLDRDYLTGWLVLATLTALAVAVAIVVRSRRGSRPHASTRRDSA